jgi:truncated hemoglobin YjbI
MSKPPPAKVKSPNREELRALFGAVIKQLGSETVFRGLLLDFYQRMLNDVMIGFFFEGKDIVHIAEQQANFILMAAGLRDKYQGKGPATAHTALPPILPGFFDRRLRILEETLLAHSIPPKLATQWVQFEESFRAVVVS